MDKAYKNFLSHFPQRVGDELMNYITNVVFLHSRYLFTTRKGRKQTAYCTHCKTWSDTEGLRHGQQADCPSCHSKCQVKASGRGRKYLKDHAYVEWYEKSLIDPNAFVVSGFYVLRDYTGDFTKVETEYSMHAEYLFQQGKSTMYVLGWRDRMEKTATVFSEFYRNMNYEACFTSMENIEQVVKGTTFQYSEWKQYINHRGPMYKTEYGSMIPFFDLAAKYPCIEYLTKMGFKSMVEDKLYGGKTYGAIYWRGKRIDKVLRLNKQEIKGLMASNVKEKNCALLYSYHYFRKKGMRLSYERAKELEELIYRGTISNETFNSLLRKIEFKKLINYLLKQLDKRRKSKYGSYESVRNVLITLKDYHNDCNELGIELNNEWDLFPSDLYPRHEKLTKRLKIKHDKELNERIKQNLKLIKHLNYSLESLFIRPAASSEELFAEGKALNHCVGGYAARYSIGDTIILFIRRFDQPELPFYTVEVQGNRVIQVRGDHNCSPTKEVQAFLDAFKQEKLKKKKVKGAA